MAFLLTTNQGKRTKSEASPATPDATLTREDAIVSSKFLFASTGTPEAERDLLKLRGILPPVVESAQLQKRRVMSQLRKKSSPLDKYTFLAFLRNTNANLFYACLLDHLEEITPIIYTPTVGAACQNYSHIYPFLSPPGVPDGLFISYSDLERFPMIFENWRPFPIQPDLTPQIAVITDGSRILGLGDLGVGGMGIPVGKLQLFTAAGGIDPRRTLPITLDLGTNNKSLIEDEFYIGSKLPRRSEEEFHSFMDSFLAALRNKWPKILIQFEDFSSEHAFELLSRHRERYFCFNDDIQGTGAVILAGFINAIRLSGVPSPEHRILFFGAGSAGVGVAKQLMDFFIREGGLTEEEARGKVYLVDSKGLVTADRSDKLAEHKLFFARKDNNGKQYGTLMECLEYVKPTALVGLSSQARVFTQEILRKMKDMNKRPIVFPLSNPADQAECTFEEAMKGTDNTVLFASGTTFPSYTIPGTNDVRVPGQGNNMYCFPGIGTGCILARPPKITDSIIYASARAVADSLNDEEKKAEWIYPRLTRIREVSIAVAAAVCKTAVEENLATDPKLMAIYSDLSSSDESKEKTLKEFVKSNMWSPTL